MQSDSSSKPSLADLGLDAPAPPKSTSQKISIADLQRESEFERSQPQIVHIHHGSSHNIALDIVAVILAIVFPGAGHLIRGKFFAAAMWFVLVVIGYMLYIIPGIILHVFSVGSALVLGSKENDKK